VVLAPASQSAAKVYRDSTGSLLEVGFQLRTFVKPPSGNGADSVAGGRE
jgi:hypothetical protein